MPDYYFHYTSREFAQSISSSGWITTRMSGDLYLTRDLYERGAEALDRLAIDGKAIEVVGLIPGLLIVDRLDEPVFPIADARGRLRRKGGGTQVRVVESLPSAQIKWLALSPP